MDDVTGSDSSDRDGGRSVIDSLKANGTRDQLEPPLSSPRNLPCGQLSPPMFERLVAEFALRIDGLSRIRVYGRSGQSQGGLDLIGWSASGLTVYQVRRIERLKASALRKAVEDFARGTTDSGEPKARRVADATRFVLVTGCVADDRAVDDELVRLNRELQGNLEIALYDNTELSIRLRNHGPLVYGIFGAAWAEAFCGYRPPPSVPSSAPPGRAYLHDPVDILGFSDVLDRAEAQAADEPVPAAETIASLAKEIERKGFTSRAHQLRRTQLKIYRESGQVDQALSVAVGLVIAECEDGGLPPAVDQVRKLINDDIPAMRPLIPTLEAITTWAERGYDLASVAKNLQNLLESGAPHAVVLLRIVAEQVLADDDPRDDHTLLLELIDLWKDSVTGLDRVRLMCCAADFRVWSGTAPTEAFAEVARLAFAGHVSDDQAALIQRRNGRALAATDPETAIDHFRKAVLDASECDLGGDMRDALRSIAFLTNFGNSVQPMEAARSVADRNRLFDGIDRTVVSALEALAADKLPKALRNTREWIRQERINGALMDETVALAHCGGVYTKAGEHAAAARAFVRGGTRKKAKKAADRTTGDYVDVSRYLESRQLVTVHQAAAACLTSQADHVPDDQVAQFCHRLSELADEIGTERLFVPNASIEALRTLAAFGTRLPPLIGAPLLDKIKPLIERPKNTYRHCDSAVLDFLTACARHSTASLAEQGVTKLARCVEEEVSGAEDRLRRIGQSAQAVELLRPVAEQGNRGAIDLLASWGIVTPAVRASALAATERLLERPVGQPRSSWTAGVRAQETASQLGTVLRDAPDDVEVVEVHDRLVTHLLHWVEDGYDIVESRSEAAHALRILSTTLPTPTRAKALAVLLGLHDDPQFNSMDSAQIESLHPLSNFRFNTGALWFHTECLYAAAAMAESPDQRDEVWTRIGRHLTEGSDMSDEVAGNLARASLILNETQPINIGNLASHQHPVIRQAAVTCWVSDPGRVADYAARFAADSNWRVRASLAHAIHDLQPYDPSYDRLIPQLQKDPHHQVRSFASAS